MINRNYSYITSTRKNLSLLKLKPKTLLTLVFVPYSLNDKRCTRTRINYHFKHFYCRRWEIHHENPWFCKTRISREHWIIYLVSSLGTWCNISISWYCSRTARLQQIWWRSKSVLNVEEGCNNIEEAYQWSKPVSGDGGVECSISTPCTDVAVVDVIEEL